MFHFRFLHGFVTQEARRQPPRFAVLSQYLQLLARGDVFLAVLNRPQGPLRLIALGTNRGKFAFKPGAS